MIESTIFKREIDDLRYRVAALEKRIALPLCSSCRSAIHGVCKEQCRCGCTEPAPATPEAGITLVDPAIGFGQILDPHPARDDAGLMARTAEALSELMDQLTGIGIASDGNDEGQWHGTEGLSFTQARTVLAEYAARHVGQLDMIGGESRDFLAAQPRTTGQ